MEPSHEVAVRPTRPEDAAAARRASYEGWRDTYVRPDGLSAEQLEALWAPRLSEQGVRAFAQEIAELQVRADVVQLVAELDGVVVGTLVARLPQDGPQELRVLYVATAARGRGVGAALIEALLARADTARPVQLGVAAFNKGAQRFYRRHGFEPVPGSERIWNDVLPEIAMTRPAARH